MNRKISVLAIDPAMRNWGLAHLLVDPSSRQIEVLGLRLVQTESQAGKTVRKSSDDLRRATEAYGAARHLAEVCDLIMAEVPSGSQSSRASLGAGMSIGLLAALGSFRPLIQVSPIEAKKAVTGRKTASKDEMIQWATAAYPKAGWLTKKIKGVVSFTDANEHLADALAIAHAGVETAEFRGAVSMMISTMARAA
jgi:Holliday junction resolvasome RuvABC endonuclease subunit